MQAECCCYSICFDITQSFGCQDYYNKSLMMILGSLVYYSAKISRHRQYGLSFAPKKILTWVPREARGGLKATTDKRETTLLSLYPHSFLLLSVSFSQSLVFPGRLCSKPFQQILDIVGLSQAEL